MSVNNVKTPGTSQAPASGAAAGLGKADKAAGIRGAASAYAKAGAPPAVSDAANVQISAKARELSQAKKVVENTPDIREDKVAKFKDLIAKGEYKPDAGKIADGIFKEAAKDELSRTPDIALE